MVSEYEKRRLANIKQNQEILQTLGLKQVQEKVAADKAAREEKQVERKRWMVKAENDGENSEPAKRKQKTQNASTTLRRSTRRRGKVSYTTEKVITDENMVAKSNDTKTYKETAQNIAEQKKRDEEEFMKLLEERMRDAKECLVSNTAQDPELSEVDKKWKEVACTRWGDLVKQYSNDEEEIHWKEYVLSRLPQPYASEICKKVKTDEGQIAEFSKEPKLPISPVDLLQEHYAGDVWKLLVCCLLMSRVSSAKTKQTCLFNFFQLCPTPSLVLGVDLSELKAAIGPLGLFENRVRSVIEVSKRFLEMPKFEIGLSKELKVYGIGEFGYDSYLIFSCGMGKAMTPNDKSLRAYCLWQKSQ